METVELICAARAAVLNRNETPVRLYLTKQDHIALCDELRHDFSVAAPFMGMPITEAVTGTVSRVLSETGFAVALR